MRNAMIPVLLVLLTACGGAVAPVETPTPDAQGLDMARDGATAPPDAGPAPTDAAGRDSGSLATPSDAGSPIEPDAGSDAGAPAPDAGGFAPWCTGTGIFWLASGSLCGQQEPVACVGISPANQCGESLGQAPCNVDGTPATPGRLHYCVVGLQLYRGTCAPCE